MANFYEILKTVKQSPGGSLYVYLSKFLDITSKVTYRDQKLEINIFIDGLDDFLKAECKAHKEFKNFLELELFVKAAYLARRYPEKSRIKRKQKKKVTWAPWCETAV